MIMSKIENRFPASVILDSHLLNIYLNFHLVSYIILELSIRVNTQNLAIEDAPG
jgi:hypothetical protein